jgi:hypothetical protein
VPQFVFVVAVVVCRGLSTRTYKGLREHYKIVANIYDFLSYEKYFGGGGSSVFIFFGGQMFETVLMEMTR